MAFYVVQPAVITAPNAARFDFSVVKRCSAMRAARVEQAGPSLAVAKQDQVLAEHAHQARRRRGIARDSDWMPVAPQQLAHRRTRADMRELVAILRLRPAVRGAGIHQRNIASTALRSNRYSWLHISLRMRTSPCSLRIDSSSSRPRPRSMRFTFSTSYGQ